ncbi:hypothetical protein LOZ80_38120 [Paenibacillus sp. HWE-109]|uniref:hypothetical protein n=1 Tax=Paenibacillus sp. HWE-109 TaxID=1306526 RepID=UPI001EE008C9|nr:hypothetical protein [Paenibacillus sp. HWE-109]UKS27210.1 hypothetical protein LOZ80_38120 [Paenibacillus sp. HWE-109]
MSQNTGNALIVIAFILLSLWLMGGGSPSGGRGTDYEEIQMYDADQYEQYESYP